MPFRNQPDVLHKATYSIESECNINLFIFSVTDRILGEIFNRSTATNLPFKSQNLHYTAFNYSLNLLVMNGQIPAQGWRISRDELPSLLHRVRVSHDFEDNTNVLGVVL